MAFGVLLFVAVALAGVRSHVHLAAAVAVMAATVGLLAWWLRPRDAVGAAAIAWLFTNGLLVNRYAQLRWNGTADAVRVGVFVGVVLVAIAIRELQLARRRAFDMFIGRAPDETSSTIATAGDIHA